MARFYFDMTVAGNAQPDEEGVDLPSLEAARREAMVTVAAMIKDDPAPIDIVVQIRDNEPRAVARVRLSLESEEMG